MPEIALRPISPGDEELLYRIYASTREEELAPVGWSPEEKVAFLRQQFTAQHRYYQEHYVDSRFDIVLADGLPIGRLYVARWTREIRLIDIALLPAYRRRGIGGALLRELLAEGEASGRPVTIHVEVYNPALALYERLGFRKVADRGVYQLMEWRPRGEVR
jgi:ribosomal protein S18 acetylase RimI-like enzyme